MSDLHQIENDQISLEISSKGAEMKHLFHKAWNKEILWSGDSSVWDRTAPILFPIVGKLKEDEYTYQGKTYRMPRHGFARDSVFTCTSRSIDEREFLLTDSKDSFLMYPFKFELRVNYKIEANSVRITYKVKNIGLEIMYFSIGGHPGFATPKGSNFEIIFEKEEESHLLLTNNLIDENFIQSFKKRRFSIEPNIFKNDAIIFKDLKSQYVDLINCDSREVIRLQSTNHSFYGIWGKESVPFVCLEPWQGVADTVNHNKEISNKLGILKLLPNDEYNFNFQIELMRKN